MSKKCNACGAQVEDQAAFCQACGSADLIENEVTPTYQAPAIEEDTGNGNVVLGIVGAVLLALVGGIVYFAIYQLGVIAGIIPTTNPTSTAIFKALICLLVFN